MYSQNNEEEVILSYFENKPAGKFIDIGAFHPTIFSNTRCLVERGWAGVYVEPSPACTLGFIAEYSNNPKITLVQKAISDKNGKAVFFDSQGDALSTLSETHMKSWERVRPFTQIEVETLAMSDFLEEHVADVTFMSIDVEGTNVELFNLLPDSILLQLQMFCIEHQNSYSSIEARCATFGFKRLLLNGENIILAK